MGAIDFQSALFLCICLLVLVVYRSTRPLLNARISFPTYRWPILGNALTLPRENGHMVYKKIGDQLGTKMVYLEAMGHPILIINDFEVARDLLEKRSNIYSSRPRLVMLTEVVGITYLFGILPYGETWRKHRRMFQQHVSTKIIHRVHSREVEFARKGLLPNIYQSPDDIYEHLKSFIGGVSLSLTYGLKVQRSNDPLIRESKETLEDANEVVVPGKYLVNVWPWLKYVPEWMPFTGFKQEARRIRRRLIDLTEKPYHASVKGMESGTTSECFVTDGLRALQGKENIEEEVYAIKGIGLQVFNVGFEADIAALMSFVLAVLVHPEVQKKAQEEIDSVTGPDRLPDFSDQENLPYVSAVLKEVLRWGPPIPMGVAHLTTEADEYQGYHVPHGCVVMANAYAMLHDPTVFADPEEFIPERFIKDGKINKDILDPEVYATFGFGRRICPGSHIGLTMLYIVAVSLLSVYDILPALDAEGKDIPVVPKFLSKAINCVPEPFRCRVIPRKGKNVEALLQDYLGYDFI